MLLLWLHLMSPYWLLVQFSSVAQSCPTLFDTRNCSTPGVPVHHQESIQTHVHWVSDAIQPSYPLSSPSPPALNLSQDQGLFKWVSSSYQVAKVLELQPQHQSNEHPGLISFRMDWLDLLAIQRTLKSLLQYHTSKASILQCSAFFIVQLSHPYMTTGKTIALTRQTFVGKVMSLFFNMLSRLVITFFPRSKCLLMVNNLDSILKTRDITLPTKVRLVKTIVFPVVIYGCESWLWPIKKAEHRRIDAFELWCWRRLLRVPWTTRRSNQSILKEISLE